MKSEDLRFEIMEQIGIITLNRPKYRNAFTPEMLTSWAEALRICQKEREVRAVVVTGEGKSFCAGGDIKDFIRTDLRAWEMKNFLQKKVYQVVRAVARLEKPIIAAVNGPAYGAGMDMALMCDIRIASDRAEFCESYIKLGLAPGDGGAYFLPRIVGTAKAMEWLLTADIISPEEALKYGLVNMVVPHEELLDTSIKFAKKIAAYSPIAVRITKKAVYESAASDLEHHLDYISSQMALLCETQYYREAVKKFHDPQPD